mgnify:CR=1 FL=1
MTNRFKSALCGHLIQKLRVKCSVMYCFMYTPSHIALLQCHSSACCDGKGFCFIRPRLSFEDEKKQSVKKHSVFFVGEASG